MGIDLKINETSHFRKVRGVHSPAEPLVRPFLDLTDSDLIAAYRMELNDSGDVTDLTGGVDAVNSGAVHKLTESGDSLNFAGSVSVPW